MIKDLDLQIKKNQGNMLKQVKDYSLGEFDRDKMEKDVTSLQMKIRELENFIQFKSSEHNQIEEFYKLSKETVDFQAEQIN